jgi:FecR protein
MRDKHENRRAAGDYLWDRSGRPDPEIQQLEEALARFRYDRPAPSFLPVALVAEPQLRWWEALVRGLSAARLAAATVLTLAVAGGLWLSLPTRAPVVTGEGWEMQLTTAAQEPDGSAASKGSAVQRALLQVGQSLETGTASKASIAVAEIGRLEVEPMTRLRLLQSATSRKRIALDRGTIHATIWAPPGQFVVDTPSAIAVDLGCMYTLHVDDNGDGVLRTTLGWVGFHRDGRESFIPAGAACATHVQSGPGIPYFEDASETFRSAIARLEAANEAPAIRKSALVTILREARTTDALTLWHLLSRTSSAERPAVYDRLSALVPPPSNVTRESILQLNPAMLDSWWNALDLGDISLWRHWEQTWTGREQHQE